MQYILTEEEYKELLKRKKTLEDIDKQKLQKLCTEIADAMPVKFWGRTEAAVWGCILTSDDHYCDECPVTSICPNTNKHWSQ